MRRLLLSATVAAIPAIAAAAGSLSEANPSTPQNPYAAIYAKNWTGLSQPDQTLDGVIAPDAPLGHFEVAAIGVQSKTCSQRCSTTCSKSCTTTRGCSTLCKRQSDGCGGGVVRAAPPPAETPTPSVVPAAPAVVYLGDGTSIYHHSLQCTALPSGKWVAKSVSQLGDGFRACSLCSPTAQSTELVSSVAVERENSTFTLGSSEATVRTLQGTPSSVIGNRWQYDYSSVTFTNGRVTGYADISRNLKVFLGPTTAPDGYFSIGSTREQVLAVQGTPSGVIGNRWQYDYSSVTFSNAGQVSSYSNISGNLRIR